MGEEIYTKYQELNIDPSWIGLARKKDNYCVKCYSTDSSRHIIIFYDICIGLSTYQLCGCRIKLLLLAIPALYYAEFYK